MKVSVVSIHFFLLLIISSAFSKHLLLPVTIQQKDPAKHSTKLTLGVCRSQHRRESSLIRMDLKPDSQNVYITTILHLGKDRTPVLVALDSGSSHLYVVPAEKGKGAFAVDFDQASKPGTLSYLDGSVYGRFGFTSIWVSEDTIESINHEFLAVDKFEQGMETSLMGLAKGYDDYQTVLETFKKNGLINEVSFSFAEVDGGLKLILGGIDRTLVSERSLEVVVPLIDDNEYRVPLESSSIGEFRFQVIETNALFDSGNSYISIPEKFRGPIIEYLLTLGFECFTSTESNPGFIYLVCKENGKKIPDLKFKIQGVELVAKGADLWLDCIDFQFEDWSYYEEGAKYCEYQIEFQYNSDYFTLGKAFIERNYVTFELEKKQITIIQNL